MGLCIQYTAEDISLACIDAMLTLLGLPTRPDDKPWWAGSEWDTGEARTTHITSIRNEIIKWYVVPGRPTASAAASAANETKGVTGATDAITATENVGLGEHMPDASGGMSAGEGGAAQSAGPVGAKRVRAEEVDQGLTDAPGAGPTKMAKHGMDADGDAGGMGNGNQLSPDDLTVFPDRGVGQGGDNPRVDDAVVSRNGGGIGGDGGDGHTDQIGGDVGGVGVTDAGKGAPHKVVGMCVQEGNGQVGHGQVGKEVAAVGKDAVAAAVAVVDEDRESGELEAGEIPQ